MSPFLKSLTIVAVILAAFAQGNVDIPLGTCANFAVEAGTAVSFDGTVTTIATGDVGVSPGSSIGGNVILGTGSIERQSTLSNACSADLGAAYSAASQAVPTVILSLVPNANKPTADLSGLTLVPGVYSSAGSIIVSATTVTLDGGGDVNAQFIFQAATNIVTSASTSFILQNGAQAANVYWVTGTKVELGQASSFVGTILSGTAVVFNSNSVLSGRALAQTAVSFASQGTVTLPVAAAARKIMSSMTPIKSSHAAKSNLRTRIAANTLSKPVKCAEFEALAGTAPIALGSCSAFAIMAGESATFNGGSTTISSGSVGVSPGSSITGNYQVVDGSVEINSTPANQCAADRTTAYNAAAAAVCATIVDELGGLTLAPGVYCTDGGRISVSAGTVTLDAAGDSSAVWIFQTASSLYTASNTQFVLANGALAANVFWKVGSSTTIGSTSSFVGTILAYASISVDEGATISGRTLAGDQVSYAGGDAIGVPLSA